jgi:predicted ATPase
MKRYVLTGGHGCGKTSLVLALESEGEFVVREAASDLIRIQRARNVCFPDTEPAFEAAALRLHLRREREIERHSDRKRVFLDRGALDHIAYADVGHWTLSDSEISEARARSYTAVFIIEPFGVEWEAKVGSVEALFSRKLVSRIEELYREAGMPLVTVPAGPLDGRLELIRAVVAANNAVDTA